MNHPRPLQASLLRSLAFALALPVLVSAQTYLGNGANLLDGTNPASTFEVGDGTAVSLPNLGWSALTGSNVQMWDVSGGDGVILDVGGGGFNPYSVRFITDAALAANSTYTLNLEMGYVSGPGTGNASYSFSIGTWNGATFTPLATTSGGPVTNFQSFSGGIAGVVANATYLTGGSGSSDVVAIQWAQTNSSSGADYFAFDNVTLSVAAIPEPSTYAAIFGAAVLGLVMWRRRAPRLKRGGAS